MFIAFVTRQQNFFMRQKEMFSADTAGQLLSTACLKQCMAESSRNRHHVPDDSPIDDFYHYAATYWPEHVRLAETSGSQELPPTDELMKFEFTTGSGGER